MIEPEGIDTSPSPGFDRAEDFVKGSATTYPTAIGNEVPDSTDSHGEKSSSKSFAASLVRPKNAHAMYSLLNAFQLCEYATGMSNPLALGPFLEDVIYEPVRTEAMPWFVAFECMILYLRKIEDGSGKYDIHNVVHDAGGIDSVRKQALVSAQSVYPATFFRVGGGTPRDTPKDPGNGKPDDEVSNVKGVLDSATRGCAAWNLGRPHLRKHVCPNTGKCKFLHKCDQFVDDKGPHGQCLGEHKRKDCDYDPAHKVSKPVKA